MHHLPLILSSIAIICFILAFVVLRSVEFPQKSQDSCDSLLQSQVKAGLKDGDVCALWDGSQCRKGKFSSSTQECTSNGSKMPLLLIVLGVILLISAGVSFMMNRKLAKD